MKTKLLGVATALLAFAAATDAAHAQRHGSGSGSGSTAASTPAASATPLKHGPPIAGLCIYSNTEVLQTSKVGQSYAQRMQQLRSQAAAEVSGQQSQLQTDEKALVGRRATLNQEQFAKEAQPLQAREQQLNQVAEQRSRDLQYTAQHQLSRLAAIIQPLATAAYQEHNCSVLLNGDGVMAANPAMDLSPEVTRQLDGRTTTLSFDRESAPAQ